MNATRQRPELRSIGSRAVERILVEAADDFLSAIQRGKISKVAAGEPKEQRGIALKAVGVRTRLPVALPSYDETRKCGLLERE